MGLFGKKKLSEKTRNDRKLIEDNYKEIGVLIVLAKENAQLLSDLKTLQEELQYLVASADAEIAKRDEKIGDRLGDLKIILTKKGADQTKEIAGLLSSVRLLIAERNAKLRI